MNTQRWLRFFLPAACAVASPAFTADPPPKAPVPPSPYISVIYKFADTMLASGRDNAGPQKTGLFLSALDRTTPGPLTTRPRAPAGVREEDRAGLKDGPLTGCNLQHDENLLRLFYTLSELSSKPFYRDAADGALKWFLQNAPAPDTHLLPWGRRFAWDALKDEPTAKDKGNTMRHEPHRPWMLWDRCFELAPEASKQIAGGPSEELETAVLMDRPACAGFCIRMWAVAYARTKEGRFLKTIDTVLGLFEKKRDAKSGLIQAFTGTEIAAPAATLSLAIDCDGAAHRVPEPLASRLRAFAAREDEVFCALPHDLKGKGGFVSSIKKDGSQDGISLTTQWEERDGVRTTAAVALMCLARYENTGSTAYRDLLSAAAEFYLKSSPPENTDLWPLTLGHAISVQVAAWRHTSRQSHLDQARKLADMALEKFWGASPLPRASLKSEHYESITGADTLALALVELHLNILHITAVRCPPNTIDR